MKNLKTWHWVVIGIVAYMLFKWWKSYNNGKAPVPGMNGGSNGGSIGGSNGDAEVLSLTAPRQETFMSAANYEMADRSGAFYRENIMEPIKTVIGSGYRAASTNCYGCDGPIVDGVCQGVITKVPCKSGMKAGSYTF